MTGVISRRRFVALTGAGLAVLVKKQPRVETTRAPAPLEGATARIDITPQVGCWLAGWAMREKPSEAVADRLYAKALVLKDSTTKIAIIASDLIGIPAEIVADIRNEIHKRTGIPAGNILVSASHNHFGPRVRKHIEYLSDKKLDLDYVQTLRRRLAEVVCTAHENLVPVKVGAAKGKAPELIYNRRMSRADGKVVMTWVLPPPEPNLTFGPVDPEVCVLRVEDGKGKLVGSLINFACHPVSGQWPDWFYHISADYPAYAAQVIERTEGGNCLFTLGTAGDMVPIRRGKKPRFEIGYALGGEALKVLQMMQLSDKAGLAVVSRKIKLPLKKELPPNSNFERLPEGSELETEIQGIRISDAMLVSLPGEVLVKLGLEIKRRAGVENLFLVSVANDFIGYICPETAYDAGGYEPVAGSLLARGSGELIVEEVLQLVRQLKG